MREYGDSKQSMAEILTEQLQINDWKDNLKVQLKKEGFGDDVSKKFLTDFKIDFDEEVELNPEELEENIDEMMRCLHDRFVAGLDKFANYEEIDNDE